METTEIMLINKAIKEFKDDKKDQAVKTVRQAARKAADANQEIKEDIISTLGRTVINKFCRGHRCCMQERLAKLLGEITELSYATHDLEAAQTRLDEANESYQLAPHSEDQYQLGRLRLAEQEYLTIQSKWLAELGDVLAVVSSMAQLAQRNATLTDSGDFLQMAAWMTTIKFQVRERVPEFMHDEK